MGCIMPKESPAQTNWRGFFCYFLQMTCSALVAQTVFHEGLAGITLEGFVFGVFVAGFHFFLLCRLFVSNGCGCSGWLGAQAAFHEGLAFIALFVACVFVASGHLALLCRFGCGCWRGGRRRTVGRTQRHGQA